MSDVAVLSEQFIAAAKDRGIDAPAPGLHPNTPMETYHQWRAASNSRLTKFRRSPAHLKAYLDEPTNDDTAALIMGRAIHSAILEPDDFLGRYTRAPEGLDRRTKAGKAQWEELVARFGDGCVLKWDDFAVALGVRDAVYRHPRAAAFLTGEGHIELSLTWDDAATGVRCKARLDRYAPFQGGVILDLKSARNASPQKFERAIYEHGYHRQFALYAQGAEANGLPVAHPVVIAVEKEPPFNVAFYRLTEGALDAGAEQLAHLLPRYAECLRTNVWPGYTTEIVDIAVPAYAWDEISEETAA